MKDEQPPLSELARLGRLTPAVGDEVSLWVRARWAEWAAELGFTRSSGGSYPHEIAQQCGHTAGQFDAWLERKVRGSAEKGLDDVEG